MKGSCVQCGRRIRWDDFFCSDRCELAYEHAGEIEFAAMVAMAGGGDISHHDPRKESGVWTGRDVGDTATRQDVNGAKGQS